MRPGSSCARLQAIRLGQGLAHAALGLSPPSGQAGQGPWPRAASGLCSRLPPATLGSHATPPSGGRSACNTVIWWPLCVQHCHLVATLHLPPIHSAGVKTISGDQTLLQSVFFKSRSQIQGLRRRHQPSVTVLKRCSTSRWAMPTFTPRLCPGSLGDPNPGPGTSADPWPVRNQARSVR